MSEKNGKSEQNFELEEPNTNSAQRNEYEFEERGNSFSRIWNWLTKDKERLASIIFLSLFVVVIIVLAALNLNMGKIMTNIVDWFETKVGLFGIFLGIFVISIFGNFTVIFPVPYTIALVAVATRPSISALHVVLMGIAAGAGAALGESSAWLIGRASKKVIEGSMEKQVARAQKWIDKGLAPLIIFLFAATPLPDDAILIFIGLLGYALWKTIIWCFFGKIALTTGTGLVAKYLAGTSVGGIIFWAFGLQSDGTAGEAPPIWLSAIVWIASIGIIALFLFIDWGDLWNRMSRNTLKNKYRQLIVIKNQSEKSDDLVISKEFQDYDPMKSQKRVKISKEASYWQCVTESENEKFSEYHELYTLSYVTGKFSNIILNSKLLTKIESNIAQDAYEKVNTINIEKLILPKKYQELLEIEDSHQDLTENVIYLSFKLVHPTVKKNFKLDLLIEKISDQELKLRCIGEREAQVIKSFKSISPEEVLTGYLSLISNLTDNPEQVKSITYAKYTEKMADGDESSDSSLDS